MLTITYPIRLTTVLFMLALQSRKVVAIKQEPMQESRGTEQRMR